MLIQQIQQAQILTKNNQAQQVLNHLLLPASEIQNLKKNLKKMKLIQ